MNIKSKFDKVKRAVKKTTVQDVALGLAIGVPTAGCLIMGSELIARDLFGRAIYKRLYDGEVIEQVLNNGAKLVVKLVKAGEEACSCELT